MSQSAVGARAFILTPAVLVGALLAVPGGGASAQPPGMANGPMPAVSPAAPAARAGANAAPTAGTAAAESRSVRENAGPPREPAANANANATPDPRTAPAAANGARERAAATTPEPPFDLIWFPTADGRLVPVPRDAALEEFLQWKAGRPRPPEGRDYSIAAVEIAGSAGDESAELTATIEVEIERDDIDVLVPLALPEAHLVSVRQAFQPDVSHQGDGEARFERFDRREGYRWSFRGRGRHTLTLGLLVEIQKQQLPTRRIALSVPRAAVSSLKLRVPVPADRLTVPAVPEASIRKTAAGENETEIAVFARERFNLSWQPLPELKPVETVLQAETTLRVEITGESVLLNPVTQRIRALEGSFESVGVWLPPGFEVLELLSGEQALTPEPDPHQPGRTLVRLPAATTGPVELRWRLRAPFPADGRLQLDGFRIERALSERGEIAVHAAEGYRVSRRSSELVHRSNVSPTAADGRPLTAYSFWRQPFSLMLDVQQVPPHLTADPYYFVLLRERRAQLVADLWFDVHEGAVDAVTLDWPEYQQQGWSLHAEPPGLVERTPQFDAETGSVRIGLVRHQSQGFRMTLRAEREVPPGGEPFDLELPGLAVSSLARPVVVVANAHNVESKLLPAEDTAIRPLGAALREKAAQLMVEADLPDDYLDLRRTEFRVESEQLRFTAAVTVHSQQIETESIATVSLRQDRLEVFQEILYRVAYEPLSQIRLAFPEDAQRSRDDPAERFTIFEELEDGTPVLLRPGWSGLEDGGRLARCTLSSPRIGTFRIIVRSDMPAPRGLRNDRPARLRIPAVSAAEGERGPLRVRLESTDLVQLAVDESTWTRQLRPDGTPRHVSEWMTDQPAAEIPLTLAPPQPEALGEYTVPRAHVVSELRADGTVRCVARFRFEGAPAVLAVEVPEAGAATVRFWWDHRRLAAEAPRDAEGSRRFVLAIPAAERAGSRLLTVEFDAHHGASFGLLEKQRLAAPRVPGVWVEQVLWQVLLPEKQHLFTEPPGFTPRYRWDRSGIAWRRITPAALPSGDEWIGASAGPDLAEGDTGRGYEFLRFGGAGTMSFRTMSSAALIASGAGLAWALGFVLLTVAAARNVLTVFSAGLVVAVAAAFFPGPLAVLLQPVIVGLALAVLAAAIDGYLRRKRMATVVTFSSPSDYSVVPQPSSSVDRPRPALVGSNEATAMRPASSYGPLESLAAPEAGSRT